MMFFRSSPYQSPLDNALHTGAIYAIASYYDQSSRTLSIVSGGSDDRAYLQCVIVLLPDNSSAMTMTNNNVYAT